MYPVPLEQLPLKRGIFVASVVKDDYDAAAVACVESATRKLMVSEGHPVMLLGKVQSGKTKTFLGIIAYCFDNGFDIGVILTKGTRALAQQTLRRLQKTFDELWEEDVIRIYDIMHVPANLPPRDRRRKILLVVKKEDDNLNRLSEFLFSFYPDLGRKRVLLIDDEADLASVGFRGSRARGVTMATIATMIENLRARLDHSAFLQVTATPYALYLQPEAELDGDDGFVVQPLRPAFTEIVPIHDRYVGGDTYFVRSQEPGSVESYMHVEVEEREFTALKSSDGRRLRLADVLTAPTCAILRRAMLDFVIGASIRRLQQRSRGLRRTRYSMVVHTEQARAAHHWQMQVASKLAEEFIRLAEDEDHEWDRLVQGSYERIRPAVEAADAEIPTLDAVIEESRDLVEGVRVQRVNSDEDVFAMLGEDGQLRLESVLTIFIGGQILDRGVTIEGLISFYYGRNPRAFQRDTVLQHSRMYGARPVDDLPVTRFYTSERLHGVMQRIHDFDHALRVALEASGDQGVAFIMEERGLIRPCAPNKVLLSKLTSLTPNKRLLPVGFQTKAPSHIRAKIGRLDERVGLLACDADRPVPIEIETAIDIVSEAFALLDLAHDECVFDERAFLAAIRYLSNQSVDPSTRGQVLVFSRTQRNARRQFESGRLSNVPFSGQDAELANEHALSAPCLMLLRQNGDTAEGWRGAPFWWPVLQAPSNMRPVVFSAEVLSDEGTGA